MEDGLDFACLFSFSEITWPRVLLQNCNVWRPARSLLTEPPVHMECQTFHISRHSVIVCTGETAAAAFTIISTICVCTISWTNSRDVYICSLSIHPVDACVTHVYKWSHYACSVCTFTQLPEVDRCTHNNDQVDFENSTLKYVGTSNSKYVIC